MIPRTLFAEEHDAFRDTAWRFMEVEVTPYHAHWEEQGYVDRGIELKLAGRLDAETASMAKYWASDMQFKVLDQCVQLFGGYGYMHEYPIARAWADARVQRIYGGTNEIMKELISRGL